MQHSPQLQFSILKPCVGKKNYGSSQGLDAGPGFLQGLAKNFVVSRDKDPAIPTQLAVHVVSRRSSLQAGTRIGRVCPDGEEIFAVANFWFISTMMSRQP